MISEWTVAGMTCEHCEASVAREVGALPEVTSVQANAATGLMRIESRAPVSADAVAAAVDEAGYELVHG